MSTYLETVARGDIREAVRTYCGGLTRAAKDEIEDALVAKLVELDKRYQGLARERSR